jgi:DNA-binding response OmpR family regulator
MIGNILLIESDILLARFIEIELRSAGYCTTTVHNGQTGLRLVQVSQPDLMILDRNLRDLSGLEVCYRLRTAGYTTPIILLSVIGETADRTASLNAGANDYIAKPFRIEDLLACVSTYL